MSEYELYTILQETPNINLQQFLKLCKLTEDEFIKTICRQELESLYKTFGKKDTLTMSKAAEALDISYPHLVRLKKEGNSIRFTQIGERGPVYFPIWAIAVNNYLKTHPVIPWRITFSNLLAEI